MFLDSSVRSPRRSGCITLLLIGFGLILGLIVCTVLPPGARTWISAHLPAPLARLGEPVSTPTPPLVTPPLEPTPTPTAPPLPRVPVIPPKTRETARLFNGIQVHTTFDAEPGRQAALERETPDSYALDLHFQTKIPTAAHAAVEVARSAPDLLAALPRLGSLLEKGEVSKFYFGLYQNKTEALRQNLARLDALLSRDTFYDTDTILELQDPDTRRKVLLIQSDMDVDSDGSDADRLPDADFSDPNFQPLTSYKWPRRSAAVNPLLLACQDRLARLEGEARAAATPRRGLQTSLESLRNDIYQLEHYSSLIAKTDPYIVLPGFMARQNGHPYQPKLGDYAVVLANDRLYPAIFGDIGPNDRAGEASLRLAQAIDPRATPQRSPVNDLKITYLVFPGSADGPAAPPDLGHLRQRCQALLNEIGGSKLDLAEWANLIPAPTPGPTPPPALVPSVTPTPGAAAVLPLPPLPFAGTLLAHPPVPLTSPAAKGTTATPAPAASPAAASPAPTPAKVVH